jgi:hypothetical protein
MKIRTYNLETGANLVYGKVGGRAIFSLALSREFQCFLFWHQILVALHITGLDPESTAAVYIPWPMVLAQHGQAEKAAAHFKKAIELNPNLPFCVLNNCM